MASKKRSPPSETAISKALAAINAGRTYADAARESGLSPGTIGKLAAKGRLPRSKHYAAKRRSLVFIPYDQNAADLPKQKHSKSERSTPSMEALSLARAALDAGGTYADAAKASGLPPTLVAVLSRTGKLPRPFRMREAAPRRLLNGPGDSA